MLSSNTVLSASALHMVAPYQVFSASYFALTYRTTHLARQQACSGTVRQPLIMLPISCKSTESSQPRN